MAEGSNMCKPKLHGGSLRIVVDGVLVGEPLRIIPVIS